MTKNKGIKTLTDNKIPLVVLVIIGILCFAYFGVSALQKADLTPPVISTPYVSIQEYKADGTPNIYIHNLESNVGHVLEIQTTAEPDTSETYYRDANYIIITDSLGNSYRSDINLLVGTSGTFKFTINPVKNTNFTYVVYRYRHYYPSSPDTVYVSESSGVYINLIEDECAYTVIPEGDYCTGTTLYSDPTCNDGVITYNETLYSPICGFMPTPTETPTPDGTPDPDATETPTPDGTPDPDATETPTPDGTPDPDGTETPTPDGTEETDNILDAIYDLLNTKPEPTATPSPVIEDEPVVEDEVITEPEKDTNPLSNFLQWIRDLINKTTGI